MVKLVDNKPEVATVVGEATLPSRTSFALDPATLPGRLNYKGLSRSGEEPTNVAAQVDRHFDSEPNTIVIDGRKLARVASGTEIPKFDKEKEQVMDWHTSRMLSLEKTGTGIRGIRGIAPQTPDRATSKNEDSIPWRADLRPRPEGLN